MKRLICSVIIVMLIMLESCAPSKETALPTGDIAEIALRKGGALKGEFLCFSDSALIFITSNKITAVPLQSVYEVSFERYSSHSWIVGVLLYQVLPGAVLAGVAASVENTEGSAGVLLLGLIPAAISTVLFVTSQPQSSFDEFKTTSELKELKKFARYPGGLTQSQLKDVLKFYGQDSLFYIK